MASTTVTTISAPHGHRASFSASAASLIPLPSSTQPAGQSSQCADPAGSFAAMSSQPQMMQMSQQSQSSQQSFSTSQPASQPAGRASSTYRQYADSSARMASENPMPIFTATYSGVDVYEMEIQGVAVMRRQTDSWLNATQILKVAGVEKGRRTKILEKEIQTAEHEKVQGGYGKYQGTWIPFERGLQVCRQYGVEETLHKLLTHNMKQDGVAMGDVDTPTKEQAMAAQRKRMYNSSAESRPNGLAGTFFKNLGPTASHAVAAISKARFESPGPKNRNGQARQPSFARQASMQSADEYPGNSQQSFVSDYGQAVDSAYSTQNVQDGNEPPRKRQRVVTPGDSFSQNASYPHEGYANAFPGSPTEPNDSFLFAQQAAAEAQTPPHDGHSPLRPLPFEKSAEAENRRNTLLGLFMESSTSDHEKLELLRSMTPQELESPIDTQSHTALHWAATLSRMVLLRSLINCGASPLRVNASGETALMRACVVTNSMDLNTFPELLDVLGSTIDVRDDRGRTVLHHIAVTSAVKGRNIASRYYLESLLEWVVRQGSAPSSQANPSSQTNGLVNGPAKMGIGRFMSEIVNAQDNRGDTALNIAARVGNRSIISQLLEVGADPQIANRAGLRALDFGIGLETGDSQVNGDGVLHKSGNHDSSQKTKENSDDIVTSITTLLHETGSMFHDELRTKQKEVDALHASLRMTSVQLSETRRALDATQEKVKDQHLARQKIQSLTRARDEESYRVMQLEQARGSTDIDTASWQVELESHLANGQPSSSPVGGLPSTAVLRARINAVRGRSNEMHRAIGGLKSRSREVELKYRHLVALCTRRSEMEVDALLDGLLRAVESEKGDLEIGRVRRFLGGVVEGGSAQQ